MSVDSTSSAERRARLSSLLQKRADRGSAPLSPAQQRLWFLEQLDPGKPTYHVPTVLRLEGRIDEDSLERSIGELIRRHESLRTVYELTRNLPRQRVRPPEKFIMARVRVDVGEDLDAEGEALRLISDDISQPFDLEHGPLVRAALYRLAPLHQLLVLTLHHIAADGWSLMLLLRELEVIYPAFVRGDPSPLPDPPFQYLDYVRWQEGLLRDVRLSSLMTFWRAELADAPDELNLPTDFPHSSAASHRGNLYRFDIEPVVVTALGNLARYENATLYMALLAVYATLLYRLGGQQELVIGSPIAHRPQMEMEGIVGLCTNVLPIRLSLSGDPSFRELLRRTRETTLRALQNQDLPFERIVENLRPARKLGRNPIFQALFTLQNLPSGRAVESHVKPLSIPPVVGTGRAQFDLSFSANECNEALVCSLEYSTDLFKRESGERMARQLQTLLSVAVTQSDMPISRLAMLSLQDRAAAISVASNKAPSLSGPCPEEAIARLALTNPNDVAIASEHQLLTFVELEREVAQWSELLREAGVGPEVSVACCATETRDVVIALLAVLRACGTYVPINPQLINQQARHILQATRASLLLTTTELADCFNEFRGRKLLLDRPPTTLPMLPAISKVQALEDASAYIIFTSGSTGYAKGVVALRRGIANHILALQSMYPLTRNDSVLQLTPHGFDASLWELLGPLSAGARLVSMPRSSHRNPTHVVEVMARNRISAIQVVPSFLRYLLEEPGIVQCSELRRVYCGGEPLSPELAWRFYSRLDAELLNLYGPTEATIDVTSWRCTREGDSQTVPIGCPIPGVCAYTLDWNLEPAPDRVKGELYVGGVGVTRGYLNSPGETANRFVPNPFGPPGSRLYRTGDWVRRLTNGELEFCCRSDEQIKLLGHRIELTEIEVILKQHHDIIDAAVAVSTPPSGEPHLTAMVVSRLPLSVEKIRIYLHSKLPSAAVPAVIRFVDKLPLTVNGKLDRGAVAIAMERTTTVAPELPCTDEEALLADMWSEILKLDVIGRHDNFFELGGHSLLAMQIVARIQVVFSIDVPLQQLFKTSTVASLSAWIEKARRDLNLHDMQ